jgi:hypothetical protein
MKTIQLITTLAVATALGSYANAASIIIKPTNAAEYSQFGGRTAMNTINDTDTTIETGDAVPSPWPELNTVKTQSWLSNALNGTTNTIGDQWVVYDLGDTYSLGGANIWGYGGGSTDRVRSINDFNISYATTLSDTFGSAASVANDFSGSVSNTLAQPSASGGSIQPGTFFSLSPTTARYALIDVVSSHSSSPDYVGLGEIRFTTVPEPSSTALLGLGGLALLLRRSR